MNAGNSEASATGSQQLANSDDEFKGEREPNSRSVYMITYSRADLQKVPTKEVFAEFVQEAFSKQGTAKIVQYVVSIEAHKDGAPTITCV